MKEFAMASWRRAMTSLASARSLADSDPDSAASRAYYAVFHGLTAFFALRGKSFTKHTAIRAALHLELVQTGKIPISLGQDYDVLLDLREVGDYGGIHGVSASDAQAAVAKAGAFLRALSAVAPDLSLP